MHLSFCFSSILALPASVLENENGVLVHAVLSDGLSSLKLDHFGSLDGLINPPEDIESLRLPLGVDEHFGVDHQGLRK